MQGFAQHRSIYGIRKVWFGEMKKSKEKLKERWSCKKKEQSKTRHIKRKVLCGFLVLAIAGGGAGAVVFMHNDAEKRKGFSMEGAVKKGDLEIGVSAGGTTTGTTDYQLCDFSYRGEALIVEKVLVESGDSVKKGDTLYTLTKESVVAVRDALKSNLVTYQIALAEAKLTYQETVNEAKTEYKTNCALKTTALTDYQDKLETYEAKVEETGSVYREAKSIIKNYPDELKNAETEKQTLEKQIKKYNTQLVLQQKKMQKAQKNAADLKTAYEKALEGYEKVKTVSEYLTDYKESDMQEALTELKNSVNREMSEKYAVLQKAKQVYEEAEESVEKPEKKVTALSLKIKKSEKKSEAVSDEIAEKEESLANAKKNITMYRAEYLNAVAEQTVGEVTAEQNYEEEVSTYQNAEKIYHSALKAADSDLQTAKDNLNAAKQQKSAFENLVQGNTVRADREGILNDVSYLAGDTLNQNLPLAGYQDSSVMNIEVSVDQSDISGVKVGNTVNVNLSSSRSSIEGTVSRIEAENTSESVSKVTYSVIITVDNSTGTILEAETANVFFLKETLENVLYVPVNAVKTESGVSKVAAKTTAGTTTEVEVITGESNGQYIVLESGLKEGDIYVIEMES